MSILGIKIFGKYKVSGAKGDLDKAIQIVLEAGNSMRCDHPCRRVTVKFLEIMTESRTLLGEGAGEEALAKETGTSGWDAVAAPQQSGGNEITENTMKDGQLMHHQVEIFQDHLKPIPNKCLTPLRNMIPAPFVVH